MSQFTVNTQNLTKALSQLTSLPKPSASSTTAQTFAVQLVYNNNQQLSLQNPRTQQSVPVSKQALQGNVTPGKQYQAQVQQTHQGTTLNLFAQSASPIPLQLKLSQQQFEQILRLPSGQVLATEQKNIEIKGRITEVSTAQIKITPDGSKQTLTVPLPSLLESKKFTSGQGVLVTLSPTDAQWTLQVKAPSQPVTTNVLAPNQNPQHLTLMSQLLAAANKPVHLSQQVQSSLANWLGINTDPMHDSTLLRVTQTGKADVQLRGQQPVASIKLENNALSRLSEQRGSGDSDITRVKRRIATETPGTGSPVLPRQSTTPQNTSGAAIPPHGLPELKREVHALQRLTLPNTHSPSQTLQHVTRILSELSNTSDAELKSILTNLLRQIKPDYTSAILSKSTQQHARQVNAPIPAAPAKTQSIDGESSPQAVLSTTALHKGESTLPPSQLETIRHLLSFAPIAITPTSLSNNSIQPGILGGLITLLQLTLASRISRPSAAVLEQTQQLISGLLPSTNARPSNRKGRPLSDLAQTEQKHGLIKEIGKMLATHQHNKIANVESALGNQDTFYYVLPNAFSEQQRDIELYIRREKSDEQQEKNEAQSGTCWHLTMKLDIGDTGQLLSKAKLNGQNLDVDFYTSNDATLLLVRTYLPLLKRRLDGLGIIVDKAQTQLGKIPASLQQRPYHIFETKA